MAERAEAQNILQPLHKQPNFDRPYACMCVARATWHTCPLAQARPGGLRCCSCVHDGGWAAFGHVHTLLPIPHACRHVCKASEFTCAHTHTRTNQHACTHSMQGWWVYAPGWWLRGASPPQRRAPGTCRAHPWMSAASSTPPAKTRAHGAHIRVTGNV